MITLVESPCVRNCCLNEADICVGCFRSLDDISRWSVASDAVKTQIVARAAERRLAHYQQHAVDDEHPNQ